MSAVPGCSSVGATTEVYKGVPCAVGGEDCHVVSVMRDHMGTY